MGPMGQSESDRKLPGGIAGAYLRCDHVMVFLLSQITINDVFRWLPNENRYAGVLLTGTGMQDEAKRVVSRSSFRMGLFGRSGRILHEKSRQIRFRLL